MDAETIAKYQEAFRVVGERCCAFMEQIKPIVQAMVKYITRIYKHMQRWYRSVRQNRAAQEKRAVWRLMHSTHKTKRHTIRSKRLQRLYGVNT